MRRSLIIGAGVSGCAAALELAQAGRQVEILELGTAVGGKVLDYCCKATEDCSRCGVCVAHTLVHRALRQPGIRFTTAASVASFRRREKGFSVELALREPAFDYGKCLRCDACAGACPVQAIERYSRGELVQYRLDEARCLLRQGRPCTACRDACPAGAVRAGSGGSRTRVLADQVLVAVGHEPFAAARKVRLGHGRLPNVLTGAEAESILSRGSSLGAPGESVAFVQCVGSRDPHLGRNWCSAVCCAYALRLARMLRHRDSQSQVTVYYIDLQHFDKEFSLLRRELEEGGVRFVRGLPYSVRQVPGGRLKLLGSADAGGVLGDRPGEFYDRVVLSVGLGPAAGSRELGALLGLEPDEHGFLQPGADGVYVTGTCREPQPIPESIASARSTALEMLAHGGDA